MKISWYAQSFIRFALLASLLAAEMVTMEKVKAAQTIPDSPSFHILSLLKEGIQPRLKWGAFPDYQLQLEQLYGQNGMLPLWVQVGKPTSQAQAMIASLAEADAQGLHAADYDAKLLKTWATEIAQNPRDIASFDVALSLSAMRYISNLYIGRVNPRSVNFGLNIEPKKVDWPNLLQKIAQSEQPTTILHSLEPQFPLYVQLKTALTRYRQLLKDFPELQFSFPEKFSAGARHKDVPTLRRFLYALGDLKEFNPNPARAEVYDTSLVAAVKNFQQRQGLTADGVIGKSSLNFLNTPLTDRIGQIQLGLERLRWLPEKLSNPYLIVNIPSFQLFGIHDGNGLGQHDIQMNVIVGEAVDGRHTPVFHSTMTYIIFRPYWNVPYKISAKELLPLALRNPDYLARSNLELVSNFSPNSPVYEPSYNNIEMLATGALKLRQKPGPKNALGLVKFAFPNTNNVYLHSTPSKGLFQRARRDFSHGCIRVQDPVGLAEFVLADQGEWTRERIESAMNGKNSKTVTLKKGIPVYIFYSTVLANEEGQPHFYQDIYGHDSILQNLLDKGFPYPS
jgi:murein L,D-transpeptidase YcbB/YkuD